MLNSILKDEVYRSKEDSYNESIFLTFTKILFNNYYKSLIYIRAIYEVSIQSQFDVQCFQYKMHDQVLLEAHKVYQSNHQLRI